MRVFRRLSNCFRIDCWSLVPVREGTAGMARMFLNSLIPKLRLEIGSFAQCLAKLWRMFGEALAKLWRWFGEGGDCLAILNSFGETLAIVFRSSVECLAALSLLLHEINVLPQQCQTEGVQTTLVAMHLTGRIPTDRMDLNRIGTGRILCSPG